MHVSPPSHLLKKNKYHIFIYGVSLSLYIYGVYKNDPETCFLKDQRVNISGCTGHMVSAFLSWKQLGNTCINLVFWKPVQNCIYGCQPWISHLFMSHKILWFFSNHLKKKNKTEKLCLAHGPLKKHRLWARACWPQTLYRKGWVKVWGGAPGAGLAGQGAHSCPVCVQDGMCNHV